MTALSSDSGFWLLASGFSYPTFFDGISKLRPLAGYSRCGILTLKDWQDTDMTSKAFDELRSLAAPSEIDSLASKDYGHLQRVRNNAHVHLPPNFSAFASTTQALKLASAQGVRVLGASNYYDYSIYGDFAEGARKFGIFPLFGLEVIVLIDDLLQNGTLVNDPGNPGRMYICGKGITRFSPMTPVAERLLAIIRENDSVRMRSMLSRLLEVFAEHGIEIQLSETGLIDTIANRHGVAREVVCLQERHLAQAFQEETFRIIAPTDRAGVLARIFGAAPKAHPQDPIRMQNEIRTHLMKVGKPAFVKESFLDFERAYRLILELGGIPCYPTLADGTRPICAYENPVEKLIAELEQNNIRCAEFIPLRNDPRVLAHYVLTMRRAGLVVTAGTEHNTLEMIPIEPSCIAGQKVPEEIAQIFWEGACVVAAHQFLGLHGLCGYVDKEGGPNPGFPDRESRIRYFSNLGEALIRRYHGILFPS